MRKAKTTKKGKLSDEQLNTIAKKINKKLGDVVDRTDVVIKNLQKQLDIDSYYHEIEMAIISWSNNGTKTAGALTRQIIKILKKKK